MFLKSKIKKRLNQFQKFAAVFMAVSICFAPFSAATVAAAKRMNLLLVCDGQSYRYTAEEIRLVINNEEIKNLPMPPIIFQDYTLVPAREVFEPMGATVTWNGDAQEVYINMGTIYIILTINDNTAQINGVDTKMVIPPKIINDKTMIPLRFVADSLNFLVSWEEHTRTAYIDNLNDIYTQTNDQPSYVQEEPTVSEPPVDMGYIPNTDSDDNQNADMEININSNVEFTDSSNAIPAVDRSAATITTQNHPETVIKEIVLPTNGENNFRIEAESAISKVDKVLLSDKRMYIDIYNATLGVSKTSYSLTDNPSVASVRAAQNQIEPDKVVRVVFDLKDGAEYSVALSSDRKTILVGFIRNYINDFSLRTEGNSDIFTITGTSTPGVTISPTENPDQLIIDIPYATNNRISSQSAAGRYVNGITSTQLNENTARIVLNLKEKAGYSLETNGNNVMIRITEPSNKNIEYDFTNRRLVIGKNPSNPININNFIHRDDYSNFNYTITVPANYSAYFDDGDYLIRDGYLNSINIRTVNGQTSFIFNETRILAYNVYEDSANIYIQPVEPKEKYKKIVVIDPGHGGNAPGTQGYGLIERDINLDIGLRVMALFEKDGRIKAYATRTTDVNPGLEERGEFGTTMGDLFVSIHCNYAETKPNSGIPHPTANGTEVHYAAHSNDSIIGFNSEQVATIMLKNITGGLSSYSRGIISNPALVVLKTARVPAVLCEVGFLSYQQEAAKLATDSYRQQAAQAIFNGIIEVFETYNPKR